MSDIQRFSLVLFIVNFVAASILAGVYAVTKPRIETQKNLAEEEAIREVMPVSIGDRLETVKENGEIKYWKVFKGASPKAAGYVFIAEKYGYSSVIETMVGMKSDGTITGVRILSQNETPGLGAKIVEIASDRTLLGALKQIFSEEKAAEQKLSPYFTEQFKGLNVKRVQLSKGSVQAIRGATMAITGATVSSKACVDSIKSKALEILNAEQ